MNKKVLLLVLLAVIIAAFFIPVTQQKSVLIKSSFLNTYSFLANPVKWERWIPELRKTQDVDSSKIRVQKGHNTFTVKGENTELAVKEQGTFFAIAEKTNNSISNYVYSLIPVDDKLLNKTTVSVTQKLSTISYLVGKIWPSLNSDNHLSDLKTFMETDSLLYGFNIIKTGVPESDLIVIRKTVVNKDRFAEAARMLTKLQVYVKTNDLKQMQPLIAQFTPAAKDSTQMKIGFYIDKAIKPGNGIEYDRMPKGGLLYAARFSGKFCKREAIYRAMKEYISDHNIQSLLLPIESYLDNKLPINDSDSIHIQLYYPAFPPTH